MKLRSHISHFELIVIKVGSNVITNDQNELDLNKMQELAQDIAQLHTLGKRVVLVSSGAISAGRKVLQHSEKTMEILQAQSSIGQPILMNKYSELFAQHNINCAQLLLTHEDFKNRQRFLNARNTINTLLNHQIVPILNENDAVSFTEITVGDNDHLAAMTAQMINADLLLLITSANGLYTDDPKNPNAKRIPLITFGEDLGKINTEGKTSSGRGGMSSKIKAALKVTPMGITSLITPYDIENPIYAALTDDSIGSVFLGNKIIPSERRKAWILSTQRPNCIIYVDAGAFQALKQNKSLLPKGIVKIEGQFMRGDCVTIKCDLQEFALGLVEYNYDEVAKIMGKLSSEIQNAIGYKITDEVIHKDNLILKD